MWDNTVPAIDLTMCADVLPDVSECELPAGIGVRSYQPGDERIWADLWASAGGIASEEAALECFQKDFADADQAAQRVFFLTENGAPIATAAAWYGSEGPDGEEGRLHWVCIGEAHQGRGLSKILIAQAIARLRQLGHCRAYLKTLTPCWVAIRMYRRFGFRASIAGEKELEGWRIVSQKAGFDFVKDAAKAD